MRKIVEVLQERYAKFAGHAERKDKINGMMSAIAENVDNWPADKTGRWLGYVQCLIVEVEGIVSFGVERDFTEPLLQEYYKHHARKPMTSDNIAKILQDRYAKMSEHANNKDRINQMMSDVVENTSRWPAEESGRVMGYAQCLLIEVEGITTVDAERDFTRPLFHQYYKDSGLEVPESVQV